MKRNQKHQIQQIKGLALDKQAVANSGLSQARDKYVSADNDSVAFHQFSMAVGQIQCTRWLTESKQLQTYLTGVRPTVKATFHRR